MAALVRTRPIWGRRSVWGGVSCLLAMGMLLTASLIDVRTTSAQQRAFINFPPRPKATPQSGKSILQRPGRQTQTSGQKEPMLEIGRAHV